MIKAEMQKKILHFGFLFRVLTPRKTTLPGDVSLMLNMTHLSLRDPLRVVATLGRVAPLLSLRDIFPVSSGTFTPQ